MTQIKAIAHLNLLTKDVNNDYYLTPLVTGTLDDDAIIERMRKKEIATKNVDGKAFVKSFLEECALATEEGYNIVTSFFRSSLGIQGVILSEDLGHTIASDRLDIKVNISPGEGAKKVVKNITVYAFEQSGATGPIVQSVIDPTEKIADHLNPGSMTLIQGMRIALKGDDASVGVLFTKSDDSSKSVLISPAKVYPNTPTKLQFTLPAEVTEGKWLVTVITQATSNGKQLTKVPRSYEYPNVIKVGNVIDGGDDKPVID